MTVFVPNIVIKRVSAFNNYTIINMTAFDNNNVMKYDSVFVTNIVTKCVSAFDTNSIITFDSV